MFHGLDESERLAKIGKYLDQCPDTALMLIYRCASDEFLIDELLVAMQNHFRAKGLMVDPYDDGLSTREF